MTANGLAAYRDVLHGCRFCPMCKPAGEVANLTMRESDTTRAQAMMLWRVAHGLADWGPREAELIYQSTLNSISQAWCINHYPVSEYMAAARAMVYEAGLAPEPVRQALERPTPEPRAVHGEALFLASEAAELGDETRLPAAERALAKSGVCAELVLASSGALAYSLGAREQARQQALQLVGLIQASGAATVIADGPQTLWALRAVHPALGVSPPARVAVVSLAERLGAALAEGRLAAPARSGRRALVHDSRSATLVATRLAQAPAIQPGYRGAEVTLGEGEVFEAPRRLVDAAGMQRLYLVWSRSLAKSCGADDGLWLTYPQLAAGLAQQRLEEARQLGAEELVTDSLLCAAHLARFADPESVAVRWLPELWSA